jgi:uncharacterized membrane protein YbhN (UPF0104 family)
MGTERRRHRHCGWCRWFWAAFGAVVVFLLWRAMSALDWDGVWQALRGRSAGLLAVMAVGALASHALFATFDVISSRYAQHRLPAWRAWCTALVCYAFTLNLGSIVGSVGLRLRLYRKQGLETGQIMRVVLAAMAANWSGYFVLLAVLPLWSHDNLLARVTGGFGSWAAAGVSALLLLGYFVLAWRNPVIRFRGRRFRAPKPRLAAILALVGASNWVLMGGVLWLGFDRQVGFADTLLTLLAAAIAGAMAHVPGGWGVLEFVALQLLAGQAPPTELVAGVLAYRAVYYLLPLALALVGFFALEHSAKPAAQPHGAPRTAAASS